MTGDIRAAVQALHALWEALPEHLRRDPWVAGTGAVWTQPQGEDADYLVLDAVGYHDQAEQVSKYVATVASPDVVEALERMLKHVQRFIEVNETIPLGAAFRVADMIHAAQALADAITRRAAL